MVFYFFLTLVILVGLIVGSFLNVAIARLPLEKSLIWPGSRCGSCQQPVRWFDNLPLVSYVWLRGRCRTCGARFSLQYFLVELATALGFVGLFWLEVVWDIHHWHPEHDPQQWARAQGYYPWASWLGFGYHAILFSLLLAASVTDLNGREIPLPLTVWGTLLGLVGAALMPWPWPWTPAPFPAGATPAALPGGWEWMFPGGDLSWPVRGLREGIQPLPVWGPLPVWLAPGGNWQTGLATGILGALVGTFMMRCIGFVFTSGLGKDALGMGDADLMMMVGAFVGWQIVVIGLFVSVIPAVLVGVLQLVVKRDNSLPFGPSLAAGTLITYLGWQWRPAGVQMLLFSWLALLAITIFALVFMFVCSVIIRRARPMETTEPKRDAA